MDFEPSPAPLAITSNQTTAIHPEGKLKGKLKTWKRSSNKEGRLLRQIADPIKSATPVSCKRQRSEDKGINYNDDADDDTTSPPTQPAPATALSRVSSPSPAEN
ncbi:ubiquitin-specific protease 6 [Striga asiatica]|uniref:Ubiquitin-specific protease 6 n=1 Tax=Striga asiatica TaxID=4170 RepID=A0A5A7QLC0_STRAF|nr:ubiquitin-specific protease 6 [Striga asiatica]